VNYETQGTGHDSGACGHELQGRSQQRDATKRGANSTEGTSEAFAIPLDGSGLTVGDHRSIPTGNTRQVC
jgi:hypothetical protein